ncbi:MAG: LysM peptidoglycan-binding domain-containing protein [Pseudomonadota bacterium]
MAQQDRRPIRTLLIAAAALSVVAAAAMWARQSNVTAVEVVTPQPTTTESAPRREAATPETGDPTEGDAAEATPASEAEAAQGSADVETQGAQVEAPAGRDETTTAEASPDAEPKAEPEAADVADQPTAAEDAATAAGEDAAADETDAAETAEEADGPQFDVVRIEPSGDGLVAGRATPGAEIDILLGDRVVGKATAAADGAFVALIEAGRGADPQLVKAREAGPDGVEARESAPLIVLPQEGDEAPVIVAQGEDAPRLVQPTPREPGAGVTLDAIRYEADGRVVFAGRAEAGAAVRLYLNGRRVGEAQASDDASWSARADAAVPPGVYRLRIDQLASDGSVASRVETPFQRQATIAGLADGDYFTVQRGDNLWAIAENIYGEGARYTLIFGANRGTIRNPDLIFPGQVFELPKGAAGDAAE